MSGAIPPDPQTDPQILPAKARVSTGSDGLVHALPHYQQTCLTDRERDSGLFGLRWRCGRFSSLRPWRRGFASRSDSRAQFAAHGGWRCI